MNLYLSSVWIGYKTDDWHRHKVKSVVCICGNKETAIELIVEHAKSTGDIMGNDQTANLHNINRTRKHCKDGGDYEVEEITLNKLL